MKLLNFIIVFFTSAICYAADIEIKLPEKLADTLIRAGLEDFVNKTDIILAIGDQNISLRDLFFCCETELEKYEDKLKSPYNTEQGTNQKIGLSRGALFRAIKTLLPERERQAFQIAMEQNYQ